MRDRTRPLSAAAMLLGVCLWIGQGLARAQEEGFADDRPAPDTASLLRSGSAPSPHVPMSAPHGLEEQLLTAPPHETGTEHETCAGWGSIFIDGEYLLMQPRRRALDYVIVSGSGDGTPQGPINNLGLETASGIRIGGGYQTPNGQWQIGGYYTYLHSHSEDISGAPAGGVLYATLTHPGFISLVSNAAADTNLNYQIFDLEVARRLATNDNSVVRIFGGPRFAWIDQNFSAFYNGISANQAVVNSPETFFGAGLRVGADGEWMLVRGLGFYGRAAGSLLSGNFTTTLQETNNAGVTVLTNVSENFNKVVPVAELGMGLCVERGSVRARIGYEMVNWFGLVDSPDIVHDFSNKLSHRYSDLGLQGLVLRVQWTY